MAQTDRPRVSVPGPPRLCGNCDFWQPWREEQGQGECRRRPPRFSRMPQQEHEGWWPQTEEREWCGEFRQASPPPPGGWIKP